MSIQDNVISTVTIKNVNSSFGIKERILSAFVLNQIPEDVKNFDMNKSSQISVDNERVIDEYIQAMQALQVQLALLNTERDNPLESLDQSSRNFEKKLLEIWKKYKIYLEKMHQLVEECNRQLNQKKANQSGLLQSFSTAAQWRHMVTALLPSSYQHLVLQAGQTTTSKKSQTVSIGRQILNAVIAGLAKIFYPEVRTKVEDSAPFKSKQTPTKESPAKLKTLLDPNASLSFNDLLTLWFKAERKINEDLKKLAQWESNQLTLTAGDLEQFQKHYDAADKAHQLMGNSFNETLRVELLQKMQKYLAELNERKVENDQLERWEKLADEKEIDQFNTALTKENLDLLLSHGTHNGSRTVRQNALLIKQKDDIKLPPAVKATANLYIAVQKAIDFPADLTPAAIALINKLKNWVAEKVNMKNPQYADMKELVNSAQSKMPKKKRVGNESIVTATPPENTQGKHSNPQFVPN